MKNIFFAFFIILAGALFFASCNDSTSPNTDNNNTKTDSSALFKNVHGTLTLSARITGSRSTSLGTEDLNKSEDATVNLSFDLPDNPITNSAGGGSRSSWPQGTSYGGSVNWTEILLTTYDCNGGRATDKEMYVRSFSSTASGKQLGGVQVTIQKDGSYTIGVAPGFDSPTTTTVTHTIETNCGTPTSNTNSGTGPGVPFAHDFVPLTTGGFVSGAVDQSNQSRMTGSYNGTDSLNIFGIGTTPINMPYQYTISWDLTRTP